MKSYYLKANVVTLTGEKSVITVEIKKGPFASLHSVAEYIMINNDFRSLEVVMFDKIPRGLSYDEYDMIVQSRP